MNKILVSTFLLSFIFNTIINAQTLRERAQAKGMYLGTIMNDEFLDNALLYDDNSMVIRDLEDIGENNTDQYNRVNISSSHFNTLVLENGMKMGNVINANYAQNKFPNIDLSDLDTARINRFIRYADKHNMRKRGHALLWYRQAPEWLINMNPKPQLDTISLFMRNYISTLVGHYSGQIDEWDVANEVLLADRDSIGYRTVSEDAEPQFVWYIDIAGVNQGGTPAYNNAVRGLVDSCFRWTAAADTNALLFYNDFNIADGTWQKAQSALQLVTQLTEAGSPIDGVGFQSHFNATDVNTDPGAFAGRVAANIQAYGNLTNADGDTILVHLTEIDFKNTITNEGLSIELSGAQAHAAYYSLLSTTLQEPNCNLALIWGISDRDSWVRGFDPPRIPYLLWDDNYNQNGGYFNPKVEGAWTGVFDAFGDNLLNSTFPPPILAIPMSDQSSVNNLRIDFDSDDISNALLPATILNNQYNDFTVRTESNTRWPMLFNTANPTSNDFDIGTPNQAFGGPGIGAGGVSNRTPQGNALVVSKNQVLPNETEGTLIFDFNINVTINSIDLLDMKCGDSYISLFDAQNNRIANLEIPAYGVNSFSNFYVNTQGVRKMEVHLDCGGGITGFSYCVESGTGENCDVNYSCEAADFLTTIIGDDYMVLLIDNPGTASISYSEEGSTDFNHIDTQFGVNYISNLEPCTNYNVKTSITCSNEKIRESEILNFTTDDCTGFNKEGQTEVLAGINLFPNPVSDFLTVNYDGASVKQIIIYDTVGKTIETINANSSGSSSSNVQRYVPGVYILVSSSNGASFSLKFIVE